MNVIQKKICLLGEFAVGKTSLVRRFVEGRFEDKYLSTIGVKISRRALLRPSGQLNLLVWDLAGSEEFNSQSAYLRGAAGAVVVCDLTRRETLAGLERYAKQMQAANGPVPLVFAANKADLMQERVVAESELHSLAQTWHASLWLTSAKTGHNVEAAFEALAAAIEQR